MSLDKLRKTNGRLDLTSGEMRTLACFAMSLQRKKQSKYLEIGVFGGGTIKFIKEQAKGINCTGIDLFEDFRKNIDNTHVDKTYDMQLVNDFVGLDVRLIKGDSSQVLSDLYNDGEKFDLIFIDGNHKYEAVKTDYEKSLKILNDDGFIAFHNCSTNLDPEWRLYNHIDGGPWLLTTEIKISNTMKCIYEIDRLCVFSKA